jgi:hypothetical protein
MTSCIAHETFQTAAEQPEHGFWVEGTVEVTLQGKTRRVKAHKTGDEIRAYGLTGRYETGTKAWPANVTRVIDPSTGKPWDRVVFGRDERSGRCNKASNVFFKD